MKYGASVYSNPSKTYHPDRSQSLAFTSEEVASKSIGIRRLNAILATYAAIEFLYVGFSAFISSEIYHRAILQTPSRLQNYILAAIIIATLVSLVSLGFRNLIGIKAQPRHVFLWSGIGTIGLAFSIFLTILFVTKHTDDYSRGTFVFQVLGVSVAMLCLRTAFYSWLQSAIASNRVEARRVALIGDTDQCAKFSNRLKTNGIQTVGAFPLPKYRAIKETNSVNSTHRELVDRCRSLRPDDIIILAGNEDMPKTFQISSFLSELPASIHFILVDALDVLASSRVVEFGNFLTIQVHRPPLSSYDRFIKRTFDLLAAAVGLIVLSPLCLVVSAAIKLDSRGPVLFRQKRHGFNNEEIQVFKFRTMTTQEDEIQFTQALKNDPRVTRVGHFLRRTNIDELPQLINVLLGEMSIVGPRPHAIAHNALFSNMIGPFSRRHIVKPGITGWAQVNGFRGATDTLEKMRQRIEHDLQYVDNWSFLLDIKIILMTLLSKKAYSNAY